MNEREFESALEFRICREFSGMSAPGLSELWCDGVLLEIFLLDDPRPRILGHAWICKGHDQEEWRFELLLPHSTRSREAIDWERLLPPEDRTRWIALDRPKKFIQVEPAAAIPDLK